MKFLDLSFTLFLFVASSSAIAAAPSVAPNRAIGYAMGMREYESSTIIEPRKEENALHQKQVEPWPEFVKRQREEVVSDQNLREAIQELMPGAIGDQAPFFDQVKKGIKVENIKGTDLLKIAVISGDKRFSRDLANRLAERYLKNHKPEEGGKGPIIHQKAEVGTPVEKKKQEVEQAAPEQPLPAAQFQ